MCTPLPGSAFRYAGSVATSVLPSPVRISEILPSLSTMPPTSWTSKWRMCSVRLAASRTTAKASGSSDSSVAPSARRLRNSAVLPRSSASLSPAIAGSRALICCTTPAYCFSSRSLRLPKIFLGMLTRKTRNLRRLSMESGARAVPKPPEKNEILSRRVRPPGRADLRRLLGPGQRNLRIRGEQEPHRVLRGAAVANLEMQVRAGRAPGIAAVGDAAATLHQVAFLDEHLRQVRVAGDEVVAVVDVNHVAVLRVEA